MPAGPATIRSTVRRGNDTLVGGAGADILIGDPGFDTADYSGSTAGVTIQLNATLADPTIAGTGLGGDAEGDTLFLIERVVGSAFNDTLLGDELDNTFASGLGADVVDGGAGNDTAEYSSSKAAVSIALLDSGTTIGHDRNISTAMTTATPRAIS